MAKLSIPKDGDFMRQYGGGIHQHGTQGASPLSDQNAEEFQRHMQSLETQNAQIPKISSPNFASHSNFGAPNVNSLQAPAPENFGPPQITKIDAGNQSSFGAPSAHTFKNVSANFGPPKVGGEVTSPGNVANQNQSQVNQAKKTTENLSKGSSIGVENTSGNSGGADDLGATAAKKKQKSYQTVENMEINNMLQNAMHHMKLSDPDPEAWN
ncbi:MAG: hypothetical protein S4CHLAM7_09670 [Chlamydiae bacterium]|nr:hypothetical protein [Chlamydiota bacterium]